MAVKGGRVTVVERTASEQAHYTGRMAETLFRALSTRVADRWKFVSFRGKKGAESRGIVDIVAIRRNMKEEVGSAHRMGDLFDIILVQLKGGGAVRPNERAVARLMTVKERYGAMEVVLFNWRDGVHSKFERLTDDGRWEDSSAAALFGRSRVRRKEKR